MNDQVKTNCDISSILGKGVALSLSIPSRKADQSKVLENVCLSNLYTIDASITSTEEIPPYFLV